MKKKPMNREKFDTMVLRIAIVIAIISVVAFLAVIFISVQLRYFEIPDITGSRQRTVEPADAGGEQSAEESESGQSDEKDNEGGQSTSW